jgi:integrase
LNTTPNVTDNAIQIGGKSAPVTRNPDGTILSRTFDVQWDFSGQEQGGSKGAIISFKHIEADFRQDIQSTLALFIVSHKKREKKTASCSQVRDWRDGLVYVRKVLGSSDWASLSDDEVYKRFKRALKSRIKEKKWGRSTVTKIQTAMNKLRFSGFYARKPDVTEFLTWVTKEAQQHIAIPIGLYQPIIANAVAIVEAYHSHRNAINTVQSLVQEIYREEVSRTDRKNNNNAVHAIAKRRVNVLQHSIPDYTPSIQGTDLTKILCGCAIVALAFSGVRIGELTSMNKLSYEEKGGTGIPILRGNETKRLGHAVQDTWQTHKVVKDALELAHDATQYLRDIYETKNNESLNHGEITPETHERYARQITSAFLCTDTAKVKSRYTQNKMARLCSEFMLCSGIVATQVDVEEFNRLNPSREGQLKVGGTLPKLTPHDFRRTFAVFFKRYGFGSSATIKFQYKHTNINMSDYYGNNARLQAMEDVLMDHNLLNMMSEEGIRMGVEIFDEIYNESEQLAGAGGERIAKDKFERLSSGEKVYMTRSEIERLVRNGTLSVVKLPTGGYCMNATCSRICGIGEFTTEIKPCEHQVITDNQAKVILRQNKRIIKAFREMNTGDPMMNSILIGQKQKIKRNEQMIKDFNLRFEPFDDKIKGIIETAGA